MSFQWLTERAKTLLAMTEQRGSEKKANESAAATWRTSTLVKALLTASSATSSADLPSAGKPQSSNGLDDICDSRQNKDKNRQYPTSALSNFSRKGYQLTSSTLAKISVSLSSSSRFATSFVSQLRSTNLGFLPFISLDTSSPSLPSLSRRLA